MKKIDFYLLYLTHEEWPTYRVDVTVLYSKCLPSLGFFSDLVTLSDIDKKDLPVWKGGDSIIYLIRRKMGRIERKLIHFFHGLFCMLKADKNRYFAIQIRDLPILSFFGVIISLYKKIPFIYYFSFPFPEAQLNLAKQRGLTVGVMKYLYPLINGFLGRIFLYSFVLPVADHVFVQSEQMKIWLSTRGISPDKMTAVPMGVDFDEFKSRSVPPPSNLDLSRDVIVYLGTLDRPRQIEILFSMLKIIIKTHPNVILVLVGDTNDNIHRAWLQKQADILGVSDHLIWTGWLPRNEALAYVSVAKVALSPIPRGLLLDVGSPTKVPEYLALGIPVVCNDNPDQASIIEATNAGICVPYSDCEFADAVIKILDDKENKFKQRAETVGRDYVYQFRNYKFLSKKVADTYQQIINISG